ncbi:MAG: SPOR domain-containing protein [Bacteroidales bacterium]|nr:SPOR domain-containing protein [Bacteroidales bacterium]
MSKIKTLGLALISLAMISLISCKGNKGDESSDNSDTTEFPSYDQVVGDEAPTFETEPVQEPIMIEDQQGNLTPETTVTITENDVFFVIAGSFTVYKNAQKLNNDLKALGFDSQILVPYGQYNRVSLKSFKTREEAKAAISSLKSQTKNDALWILKR